MKKLTHSTVQYLLVALVLNLLSLSCNQQPSIADHDFKTREADTTPPFVLNWQGDTLLTGVPIEIIGEYRTGDPFPEPLLINVDQVITLGQENIFLDRYSSMVMTPKEPQMVPAHSNVLDFEFTSTIVEVPDSLPIIRPGKERIGIPVAFTAEGKVTLARQPQLVTAVPPGILKDAKFDIQYLDASHGLPDSYVYDVLEDREGALWFGTRSGLTRYDGKYFMNYSEREGLPGGWILQIFEDSHGNLWLECKNKGIIKFDGHHFTFYDIKTSSLSDKMSFHSITEDKDGQIWIGAYDGFYKFCPGKNAKPDTFIHYPVYLEKGEDVQPVKVNSILMDRKGFVWLATGGGGIFRFDGQSFTQVIQKERLDFNPIYSLMLDSQGRIWATHDGGIDVLELDEKDNLSTIIQNNSGGATRFLTEDEDGTIWLCAPRVGAGYFEVSAFGEITGASVYREIEGLSSASLTSMVMDHQGHFWIATAGGGVNRIDKKSFRFYTDKDGLYSKVVSSIAEDKNGHIWFGNETFEYSNHNYLVSRFDKQNFFHYYGFQIPFTRDILKDKRGDMWFVHQIGITRYNYQNFHYYPTYSTGQWTGFEDEEGGLWFTGTDVSRFNFDEEGRVIDWINFSPNPYFNGVGNKVIDRNGNMWFFNWAAGIFRFESKDGWRTGTVTYFSENEGLPGNGSQSIAESSRGDLWITTNLDGLSFLSVDQLESDTPDFINFTEKDGLSSNSVASVIEDDKKQIWVSTANGIDLFVPLKEGEVLDEDPKIPGYKFFSFNHLDGLNQKGFSQRAVFKDSQGQIWWGSEDGVTVLDIDHFSVPIDPPANVRIVNIDVDQQQVDFAHLTDTAYQHSVTFGKVLSHSFTSVERFYNLPINLSLPHYIDHLTFHFSAVDWGAPHKIQYSYMIEGLDDDWSPLQSQPIADYRNLPSGKHTLKVKAIGEAKVWSDTFEYAFTIRPPWWQTYWAYAIYSFLILLFGYWLYQFLLNRRLEKEEASRLRELDEVKTKLYTNITHEFRTPLTIIKGMSNKMKENPKQWFSEGINMINRNSDQLLQLINQILDLRKLESGKLSLQPIQGDIIAYLKYHMEAFHSYAQERDIRLHFMSEEEELQMDFAPKELQHIMNNLVSNAIKYNKEGGDVYVTVAKVEGRRTKGERIGKKEFDFRPSTFDLQIKIRDTGIGIPEEQLPHIFDRFYQADSAAHRQLAKAGEGTGIGLALTKELVKLMDGEINVTSKVEEGTTFEVLLPITQTKELVVATELGVQAQRSSLSSSPVSEIETVTNLVSRPQVLIVEDNKDVVFYLQSCLQAEYQLEVAYNGEEGVEKALELVPDLIISDVMMPKKDGYELCSELKQDMRTSHIPIILLTAKGDLDSRLEGLEQGADAYLSKPFEEKELLVRMGQMIKLRQKLQEKYGGPLGQMATPSNNAEEQFLQKVYETIMANLEDENFGIAQLCRAMHLSRTQLHRKLKSLTNKSTSFVIREIRLQRAKELLSTTDLSISQVAYEVGFSKPGYFTEVFVETFGQTPSEWRKD